jgi:hypothetical protein
MDTITRAALIQCVEAGINRAHLHGGLAPFQKARLRLVALTATEVSVGQFGNAESGCPLTQAGMGLGAGFDAEFSIRGPLCGFYEGFDPAARTAAGQFAGTRLTVVE